MARVQLGVGAVALGVGALLGYMLVTKKSGAKTAAARYWDAAKGPELAALLQGSHTMLSATERVWVIMPGQMAGRPNALAEVRRIQSAGNVATSSTNLLDTSAPVRMVAEIKPSEVAALASAEGVAILPRL